MKIEEVPQDYTGILVEGKVRDLCYAVDEDGTYKTKYSVGWNPKNEAMFQAWDKIKEDTEIVRKSVLNKIDSPIHFYMHKHLMDVATLAQHVGMWSWKVKRHLKYRNFITLSDSKLSKYAEVFNLTVEELKDISLLENQ